MTVPQTLPLQYVLPYLQTQWKRRTRSSTTKSIPQERSQRRTLCLLIHSNQATGPIGIIDTNEFIIHRNITVRDFIETDKIENVVLIKSCMDMGTDILDFCIDKGSRGIVIEAMGRGNLPDLVPSIKRAISKNTAVVIVSRCHSGRVMSHGYPGGVKKPARPRSYIWR